MKSQKKYMTLMLSFILISCFGTVTLAQDMTTPQSDETKASFTDEELENFVSVIKVQQESEQEMINAIQGEGLELNEFNEIMQAQQNPDAPVDVSEEEMQKFQSAAEEVVKIQQGMQQDVMQALDDTGLGMETYQELLSAYQTNPEVQQTINERMSK